MPLVMAGIMVLAGPACSRSTGRSASGIMVRHEITPQPVRTGKATVDFTLTDAWAKPVTDAHITVEADMSHAGMSPVFTDAKEIQPGHYKSQVTLAMAGDWVILLHGTLANGEKLEQQFAVNGVRPN